MKLPRFSVSAQALALCVHALALVAAFALLAQALQLAWGWALLGAALALPSILALAQRAWPKGLARLPLIGAPGAALRAAQGASLGGLLILVTGATWDLWAELLSGERVDASLHLLILLLSLCLALVHQALRALDAAAAKNKQVSDLLESALRGPPILAMLCLALLLGGAFLAYLYASQAGVLAPKLLERGVIPPITLSLFIWGMALLAGKWLLTARELARSARDPRQSLFKAAYQLSRRARDDQEEFAAALWQQFEAFYTLPRYINWAIPILGFIGTVLGISLATEGLGELLASSEADFSQSLGQALDPLGIAFDTTLVALSLSVVFALCQTLLYRWEEKRLLALTEELRRAKAPAAAPKGRGSASRSPRD